MRQHKIELDVDFIGGQEPLTKEEEKAISEFIKANKVKNEKRQVNRKGGLPKRKKEIS